MRLAAPLTIAPGVPLEPKVLGCKRSGFAAVQLHLAGEPTKEMIGEALALCRGEGLEVAAFGCYGNPLQPGVRASHGVSADDVATLLSHLPAREEKDGPWRIVTFSGTLSGQLTTPHPGNRTPGALLEVKNWVRGLLPALEERNAQLLFKPHAAHCLNAPAVVATFLSELDSEFVGVALDVCSFLTPKNFHEREVAISSAITQLAPVAGIACLRDAKIENFNIAYTGPGQGQVGYAGLLKKLARYCPDLPWTIECPESELKIRHALAYVQLQAKLAGVQLDPRAIDLG